MYFIYIHILVGFDAIDNAKNKFEEQPVGKKNQYKSNAKKKKKKNNSSYSNTHKILFLI